jgi:hypothetical protein
MVSFSYKWSGRIFQTMQRIISLRLKTAERDNSQGAEMTLELKK